MKANSRCSIRFHLLVPGGRWAIVIIRLASMAHDGLARAVLPVHVPLDGDTVFAAASGMRSLTDPNQEPTELGQAATLIMAVVIARGVYGARSLAVPGTQRSWQEKSATGT